MELGIESRSFRQIAYPRDRSIVGSFLFTFGFGANHAVFGITGRIGDATMMPYMKPVIVPASIAFVMTKAACVGLASIAFVFTRLHACNCPCKHGICVPKSACRGKPQAPMPLSGKKNDNQNGGINEKERI
ncbi:MAG: hypothetical protein IKZ82_13410 [Clostridia bacterium]|nr:hypothetical protein [Clostridia bacterium]